MSVQKRWFARRSIGHFILATITSVSAGESFLSGADVRVTRDNTPGSYVRYDGKTDPVLDACSTGRRMQAEPTVAVNPRNPAVIVAGANHYCRSAAADTFTAWMGYYRSVNGGATWQNGLVPGYPEDVSPAGLASPAKGLCLRTSDPTLAFDLQGRVFYAFVCFNSSGAPANASMLIAQYDDDGARYVRTVLLARGTPSPNLDHPGIFHDKPNLAVDQTGGPGDGNVYVGWTRIDGSEFSGQLALMFAVSTDHGLTFSIPRTVAAAPIAAGHAGGIFTDLAVGPDGIVYLVWESSRGPVTPTDDIQLARSRDHGHTFETPRVVATYTPFDSAQFSGYDTRQAEHKGTDPRRCNLLEPCPSGLTFPRFISNPAVTADSTGVHVVWSAKRQDGQAKIFVRNSPDGVTFPTPVRQIDSMPTGHQWFPDIVSADGKITAVFYDSRADPGVLSATATREYCGRSELRRHSGRLERHLKRWRCQLGGNTTEHYLIQPKLELGVGTFLGDYIYVSAVAGKVWAAWTDTRDIVPGIPALFIPFFPCDPFAVLPTDACLSQGGLDHNIYGRQVSP